MPFAAIFLVLALVTNVGFFLPSVPNPGGFFSAIPCFDKIVHVGIFALNMWAIARVFALSKDARGVRMLAPRKVLVLAFILVTWAIVIELIQSTLPARSADPSDVLADYTGILVGLGVLVLEVRFAQRRGALRRASVSQ